MNSRALRCLALSFLLLPLLVLSAYANPINLGTAGGYAVLGGSAVTNTGSTTLIGNLGVSPGCALSGAGTMTVSGTTNLCNAAALKAQSDLTAAYLQALNLKPTGILTGQNLGGLTLTTGVYSFASSAQLTGQLTLEGKPGALFVFQIGSALTTATSSSVIFINSLTGKATTDPNIFWQVGSSATLGTSTSFEGNILALSSITLNTSASITCGSALAQNGAVTLQGNTITGCGPGGTRTTVPEPGTMGLLGTGLAILAGAARRKMGI
ncbi:MAG: ice-binding family protein [Candidatus Sulfotelmatobacter sp.]